MTRKALATAWLLVTLGLFFYSYGFVDFNLTLSSHPLLLSVVSYLQHIVYYMRPLSAQIFTVLFLITVIVSVVTLLYVKKSKLSRFPWRPVLTLLISLSLAYPLLSYDVFNYMFHSKILWFYHQNPHLHAPLEYQSDLWLRFMRWVHTPSAYGPVFTAIETPAYLVGFGKFVPVLYLMKLTMTAFFAWCIYLVGRIGETMKMAKNKIVLSQLMLALNPFLLLELVINSHNDAVMIAFFLLALLYAGDLKVGKGILALALSIGVKYVTALAAPALLIRSPKWKIIGASAILLAPVLLSPGRFQPWYLVWSLIPAVLIDSPFVRLWYTLASLGGLIYYIPYIATGFWNNSPNLILAILFLPLVITFIYHLIRNYLYRTDK